MINLPSCAALTSLLKQSRVQIIKSKTKKNSKTSPGRHRSATRLGLTKIYRLKYASEIRVFLRVYPEFQNKFSKILTHTLVKPTTQVQKTFRCAFLKKLK